MTRVLNMNVLKLHKDIYNIMLHKTNISFSRTRKVGWDYANSDWEHYHTECELDRVVS